MTKEDKELLLKDFSAKLTYGVMCSIKGYEEKYWDSNFKRYITNSIDKPVRITGISIDKDCIELDSLGISEVYGSDDFGGLKPYLRPMSSMTEEEAKEIAILHDIKNILSVKVTSDYIDVIVDDGVCSTERRTIWYDEIVSSIKIFDWLNKHHFDYRGLIPKGLAIEITKENNPYE